MLNLIDSLAGRMGTLSTAICVWWSNHKTSILRMACAAMAIFAVLKLGDEYRRLLLEPGQNGAIDLKLRHREVYDWFAGEPLYELRPSAVYPPATYVLLWPLLGWVDFTPARWLWAFTSAAALGWLVHLVVRESGAKTRLECLFVALIPLSMNATGVTIGNGQLILHILPILIFALLLLRDSHGDWRIRLLAAGLLLLTLVKPTVSGPFSWIALFVGGGLVTLVPVLVGYAGLTTFAVSFQESSPAVLMQWWNERATVVAATGGYADLHSWLAGFDLEEWTLWVSLTALVALGFWIYRHRKVDFWILLGVAAIVARLWAYHRVYDDVLILLPMVALYRLAKGQAWSQGTGIVAGLLLAATILAMLAPARLEHFGWPWSALFKEGHLLVWLAALSFLLHQARCRRTAEV